MDQFLGFSLLAMIEAQQDSGQYHHNHRHQIRSWRSPSSSTSDRRWASIEPSLSQPPSPGIHSPIHNLYRPLAQCIAVLNTNNMNKIHISKHCISPQCIHISALKFSGWIGQARPQSDNCNQQKNNTCNNSAVLWFYDKLQKLEIRWQFEDMISVEKWVRLVGGCFHGIARIGGLVLNKLKHF